MHDNTKPITKDELPEGIAQLVHFPARWNDQDKHFNLTSSADGRELAIVGMCLRVLLKLVCY